MYVCAFKTVKKNHLAYRFYEKCIKFDILFYAKEYVNVRTRC